MNFFLYPFYTQNIFCKEQAFSNLEENMKNHHFWKDRSHSLGLAAPMM